MLVLSRRAQQQVVFPHLGIKVSILQVRGRLVKLGIDAPDSVKVFRQEVLDVSGEATEGLGATDCESINGEVFGDGTSGDFAAHQEQSHEAEHRRRNELNVLQLRLEAIQRRIDRGEEIDAESTLQKLLGKVSLFDHEFATQPAAPLSLIHDRPTRLLVVEDSDNERRLMAFVLASHGFDVHVARDGSEALEMLKSWGTMPDVVLMDMQMPLSDGLETLHRIREDERLADLTVFAVTGTTRVADDEPVGRGWDGWFQKPLDVASLIERLRVQAGTTRSTLTH